MHYTQLQIKFIKDKSVKKEQVRLIKVLTDYNVTDIITIIICNRIDYILMGMKTAIQGYDFVPYGWRNIRRQKAVCIAEASVYHKT